MSYPQLKLDQQLCFPLYAASRLVIREYQPFLDKLNITYPQYLALLVLWEEDGITVNDLAHKLILNTNTVTPLLKRLEQQGLVTRTKSNQDERKVVLQLTQKAKKLEHDAACIPLQLIEGLQNSSMSVDDLVALKHKLDEVIRLLK
jgi:MarR family transcriptional regulator, organic hydroperoxide resistance regulator